MKPEDLKIRRETLGMSQSELAKALGKSRKTINTWENSEELSASASKMLQMYFKEVTKKADKKGGNVTDALEVNFDELKVMYVPLVNKFAYAGYLNGFGDSEYVEELPKIPFANDKENKGDYVCFEVKGDSMDDGSYESLLEGDILLCRDVKKQYWKSKLHINKWDFVIVHKYEGILVKRITKHYVDEGVITIHSLNEYYEDSDLHLNDVQKIFNIVDYRRKKSRR
jgi:phage repressor protein C with HTH and peptisase S24 domain